jgi:hypothetical protein
VKLYLVDFRYDHVRPKPQTSISFQPVSLPFNPPPQQNFINTRTLPINGGGRDFEFNVLISKKNLLLLVPMSYASVCRGTNDMMDPSIMIEQMSLSTPAFLLQSLCPYAEKEGICEALETGRYCPYIHGDLCDLCEMPALHPTNEKQREQHRLVNRMTICLFVFSYLNFS